MPDWEMVVVDDGSTDRTVEIARDVGDRRVRVIQQAHVGLPGLLRSYARALNETEAPLVAILEGDDAWPRDKLEIQCGLLQREEAVLSYGAAGLITSSGHHYATYDRHPGGATGRNEPLGAIVRPLATNNFIVSATVMVRRAALLRVGGFLQPQGVPYVDHPTWLALALEGPFVHTTALVGYWRRHAEQVTTAQGDQVEGNRAYVYEIMSEGLQRGLPGIRGQDLAFVEAVDAVAQAERQSSNRGRLELLRGDWQNARRTFRDLLRRAGTTSARLVALVGWLSSWLHGDIEWLFRRTGRLSWPSSGWNLAPLEGSRHRASEDQ